MKAALLPDSLTAVPPTGGAQWLLPGEHPAGTTHLFTVREPDTRHGPLIVTRFPHVRSIVADDTGLWSREVPFDPALGGIPEPDRDLVVDASWMLDGARHDRLRGQLDRITGGSPEWARRFTRDLIRLLASRTLAAGPPWDLAPAIDEAALRVIIQCTLQAPPLLRYTVQIRELTRMRAPDRDDGGADVFTYFHTNRRQPMEHIIGEVLTRRGDLPRGGLAAHLVTLTGITDPVTGEPLLTVKELISQIGMLITSYESMSAATASLVGMLLESGYFERYRQLAGDRQAMGLLVTEGARRALSFPFGFVTATGDTSVGGVPVAEGDPVVFSYAASGMDPGRWGGDAGLFNPFRPRQSNLAFGQGRIHSCQGRRVTEQFMSDVLQVLLEVLPARVRLAFNNQVLREPTGLSWAVDQLPVTDA